MSKCGQAIKASVLLASFLGLLGCAADRVMGVKHSPHTTTALVNDSSSVKPCPFSVKSIDDEREHSGLGMVVFTRVEGEGFVQWFSHGITTLPGYSASPKDVELRVTLLKAHMISLSTYKSANIIVKVDTTAQGRALSSKVYRGADGSINWASSESEVQAAFDSAMVDLKRQIAVDLSKQCASM
jgi:hypothetical protein